MFTGSVYSRGSIRLLLAEILIIVCPRRDPVRSWLPRRGELGVWREDGGAEDSPQVSAGLRVREVRPHLETKHHWLGGRERGAAPQKSLQGKSGECCAVWWPSLTRRFSPTGTTCRPGTRAGDTSHRQTRTLSSRTTSDSLSQRAVRGNTGRRNSSPHHLISLALSLLCIDENFVEVAGADIRLASVLHSKLRHSIRGDLWSLILWTTSHHSTSGPQKRSHCWSKENSEVFEDRTRWEEIGLSTRVQWGKHEKITTAECPRPLQPTAKGEYQQSHKNC